MHESTLLQLRSVWKHSQGWALLADVVLVKALHSRGWKISPLRRTMLFFATLAFLSAVAAAVAAIVFNTGLGWVVTAAAAALAGGLVGVLPDPLQIATKANDWRLVGSPLEPYRIRLRKPRPHPRLQLIQQLLSFPT